MSSRLLAVTLAAALLGVYSARAADPPSPNSVTKEGLADFDQSLERFKRDIWNVQRLTSMFGRDFRGRMLNDDLRDFVLVKSTETELQKQRSLLEKQLNSNRPAGLDALTALNKIVTTESARLDDVFAHRLRYRETAYQRDLWRQSAERLTAYKTPNAIEQLEQEAVLKLNAGEFSEVTYRTYPALQRAYAAERSELLKRQRGGSKPIEYARRTPCKETAKGTSGRSLPALANGEAPDFPPESRRAGREGVVMVDVLVATTGCVTHYAIESSSGWGELDDAALDWLETARFIPAARDGKAIAMHVSLPVNFRLGN